MSFEQLLAQRLRSLRKSAGLTQLQVARILNVARPTYASYESAAVSPDHIAIRRLARMYGVTADGLLGIKKPEEDGKGVPPGSAAMLDAATPEERQLLLALRSMTTAEKEALLLTAHRILAAADGRKGYSG